MRNGIDFRKLVPAKTLHGDSEQDTKLLRGMARDARKFLLSFRWCRDLKESYFGLGIGGVVAVFLFQIVPQRPEIDEWLWVVVGDLPPAYLVTDASPTPTQALRAYIREMQKWVRAAKKGKPVDHIIPVNVEANSRNADRLQTRLDFLEKRIVRMYSAANTQGQGDKC